VPRWSDYAIWWQVYPLGFTGAPSTALPAGVPAEHRLEHLEAWLEYAVELGCSGLLLGPIFASETHGYDTVDHFQIDTRLGDTDDFDRLIAAARERGLRVVLDGVFNHVGRSFARPEWFRQAADGAYETFEGHDLLVALNHDEPAVAEYVTSVMNHWLDRGAAGWRLDAAYAVPAEFWTRVLPAVRQRHPEAWFVGEMIHGDYAGYASVSGLDSITQYELWKAIWSSLNDGNFHELAWALKRHGDLLTPQTFVGNHDVTRLASRLADPRHLGHALVVLFTVAGIPSVYSGDEQAFQGVKEDRVGGDDEIRPAFPATPSELAPYGWPTYRLHQRLIGLRRRHPWLVRARTTADHVANRALALRSTSDSGEQLIVLLNIGDHPYDFPVELTGFTVADSSEPCAPPTLPPHAWAILAP
jgi:glycosidase